MVLRKGVLIVSKAIFRVSGIKTTSDLRGMGKHNVDRISETNLDIDRSRSDENITLKHCGGNYNFMFEEITRDLKKQHEEQMKTTRKSRQKSFEKKINEDKADVACEFLMSATPQFFEGKSREEIQKWAESSLNFVTDQIGIGKENILHAVVHMDEKTPHLHVVAVPLVEKYDGRKKQDVLAISRKHFIKTREDMAEVQTKYVGHLKVDGFDLERGLEKSGAKHLDVARYKIQETQKDLKEIESDLLEKSEQLEATKQKIQSNLEAVPSGKFRFKTEKMKQEIKTEVQQKLIGNAEIKKTKTGNYVISPDQLGKLEETINAAVAIKKDYKRLQTTDLVQENRELRKENQELHEAVDDNYEASMFNINRANKLEQENKQLKSQISDLRHEIGVLYKNTREFLKERTEGVRAFKNVFKQFVDGVKDKIKGSEFERLDKRQQAREHERGM